MLFLWVVALDGARPEDRARPRQALEICDVAETFATPVGPWRALRQRSRALLEGRPLSRTIDLPARETSARACFQWGMLRVLEDRDASAIAWLERAVRITPDDYWSQFFLAFLHNKARHPQEALDHYNQAIVLRPEAPWARFNRAQLHQVRGDWDKALDDLNRALATARDVDYDYPEARLGLGLLRQYLGDIAGAREAYESVIAPGTALARALRLNRAKLDFDVGDIGRAHAELDALVAEAPADPNARLARALLALRIGQVVRAEADLTYLLQNDPRDSAERYAHRAQARLALGRPAEAEADAANALRLEWTPSRERLWLRTLLALRRGRDLVAFDRPEDVVLMPSGGAGAPGGPPRDSRETPPVVRRPRPAGAPDLRRAPECPGQPRRRGRGEPGDLPGARFDRRLPDPRPYPPPFRRPLWRWRTSSEVWTSNRTHPPAGASRSAQDRAGLSQDGPERPRSGDPSRRRRDRSRREGHDPDGPEPTRTGARRLDARPGLRPRGPPFLSRPRPRRTAAPPLRSRPRRPRAGRRLGQRSPRPGGPDHAHLRRLPAPTAGRISRVLTLARRAWIVWVTDAMSGR